MKEKLEDAIAEYILGGLTGTLTGILIGFVLISFTMPSGPSIQFIENKKQETKTVCAEKEINFVHAYNQDNWGKLDSLPKDGVIKKEDYRDLEGGNIWVTLNTSAANLSAPDKVKYHSVSTCLDYKEVPKYGKVEVEQ